MSLSKGKWRCGRCDKPRGKANPLKDGWHRFTVDRDAVYTLCPECSAEFFNLIFAAFKLPRGEKAK